MSRVRVTCEINDYSEPRKPSMRIHSHWNSNSFVELEINGEKYTVDGKELKIAIDNCMNVGF